MATVWPVWRVGSIEIEAYPLWLKVNEMNGSSIATAKNHGVKVLYSGNENSDTSCPLSHAALCDLTYFLWCNNKFE